MSFCAELRRYLLLRIVTEEGGSLLARGTQAALARRLGVSQATISRDVRVVLAPRPEQGRCNLCGARAIDEEGDEAIALGEERIHRWLMESGRGYY